MNYDRYSWIDPPRPEKKIPRDLLGFYEKKEFWCQMKMNGTYSMVFVPPKGEGDVFAKTREGVDHRAWSFTPESTRVFEHLRGPRWGVFACELLHSKGGGIRDTNYLHDVLVWDGEYLLGTTYSQRWNRLASLLITRRSENETHCVVDDNAWLAKNHTKGFKDLFDSLEGVIYEGLVLKKPNATLAVRGNESWQVKCRRFNENFGF
jgi:hypothetical protein